MRKNLRFERLLQDHHATLGQQLRKLEAALDPPARPWTAILRHLTALQARLQDHFALEEQGGYLSLVLDHSPQLYRVVQKLLAEHDQLSQLLATLIAAAEACPDTSPDSPFVKSILEWVALVRQHEAQENGLVQDTCNRVIAAED